MMNFKWTLNKLTGGARGGPGQDFDLSQSAHVLQLVGPSSRQSEPHSPSLFQLISIVSGSDVNRLFLSVGPLWVGSVTDRRGEGEGTKSSFFAGGEELQGFL